MDERRNNMIGIYEIYSTVTKKCYIGSSIQVEKRWTKHRSDLRTGQHHCKPLQAEYNELIPFIYRMIETCTTEELEEKEAFYISESDCYNTSLKTGTAMRDKAVSAKAVASRLDQSGMNGSAVKATKEVYVRALKLLASGKGVRETSEILLNELSPSTISRIQTGKSHGDWMEEEYPLEYKLMLRCAAEEVKVSTLKVYQIKHKKGEEFSGNVPNICGKLQIKEDMCRKLIQKKLLSVKGWRLVNAAK